MNAAKFRDFYQVFISLGSNISPEKNIPKAVNLLHAQLRVVTTSSAWESPPFSGKGLNYINAVANVYSDLDLLELNRQVLRTIEAELGRVRGHDPASPREIDLDIVIFNDYVVDDGIWDRSYFAVPLAQLIPDYAQPVTGKTLAEIAQRLLKNSPIFLREDILRHSHYFPIS